MTSLHGPSPHLSWDELACHDASRTPYPAAWRLSRAVPLATEFEIIRAAVGLPLRIGSGYRTPAHNTAIGGAPRSQHVQGRALDLYPPDDWRPSRLLEVVVAYARQDDSRIRYVEQYPWGVHFDIRPTDRLVIKRSGKRAAADVEE